MNNTKQFVVSFSGGVSSWCAARRMIDGGVDPASVVLVFADTLSESEGLYAFLDASVKNLGCDFVRLSHGLTPWELFDEQDQAYQESVLPARVTKRIAVEAGVRQGWDKYLGSSGVFIGMSSFGASAPYKQLYEHFGITNERVVAAAKKLLV